ncbi:MAG: TonB-dependent receptor plug domain-containing protein, partial [Acidobacteriota bacterium]|nr:TonB-dependent receptor plug domain-containing protein [Acidobacteriota bacterium]
MIAGAILCVFVCALSSRGQTPGHVTSTIVEGTVVDQNGAPVSGAQVIIRSSSFTRNGKTDSSGQFLFGSIPRAEIVLTIAAEGFAPMERRINTAAEDASQLRIILMPATIAAQVTVAATRTETRISETAASVVILDSKDLDTTAAPTIDDALRQVPGFSLFRRSGSRTANPTTQGVSLRGLGASGASRALVLADGIPLNDPFGGWVYWDRVPRVAVSQVEVMRGGASHLYGNSALGGVVSISTKIVEANVLSLETFHGNQSTPSASLFLSGRKRDWRASLAGEVFSTKGYILVPPAERGPVDTRAGSRHATNTFKIERWFGKNQHIFGSSSFFGESRENGTPLQTNRTHIREFAFGGELTSVRTGNFSACGYGGTQVYDQNFSAISVDR